MKLYLGGHLIWYDPQKRKNIELQLAGPTLLTDVLKRMNVPRAEAAVCLINGEAIFSFDQVFIDDGDKVAIYPAEGGG
jgi:sulfur carrier protein ThiS